VNLYIFLVTFVTTYMLSVGMLTLFLMPMSRKRKHGKNLGLQTLARVRSLRRVFRTTP
jgi:hypothetical protein